MRNGLNDKQYPDMHEILVEMTERYEESIDDPIKLHFGAIIQNILKDFDQTQNDKRLQLLSLGRDWKKDVTNEIDRLTGWD